MQRLLITNLVCIDESSTDDTLLFSIVTDEQMVATFFLQKARNLQQS
jgi:hypothetical protein